MPQEAYVFVSHCHEDNPWCREFVKILRQAGANVWYDEQNLGYGRLMNEIERELRTRPIFLVVLSPAAVASHWVQLEVNAAIHLQGEQPDRIVLPIIAQKCEVPLLWRDYRWVSGPDDASLAAPQAAAQAIQLLGLGQAVPARISWDETSIFAALARSCTPEGCRAARHLFDFAKQRGASFSWGTGTLPSVTARFSIGDRPYSVFSLYEWPANRMSLAINFEFLTYGPISTEVLARLAQRLRTIPWVTERYSGLEQAEFRRRPSLPIDLILTQPNAVQTIEAAIDELVRSGDA